MIDKEMRALIDAPLADPLKINLPKGRRPLPRGTKDRSDSIPCAKLSSQQLKDRKIKAEADKLNKLLDYYATTDLPAAKVAEHLGLYRQHQTGVDDKGKPTFERVLDVARAEQQLAWRRKANAA